MKRSLVVLLLMAGLLGVGRTARAGGYIQPYTLFGGGNVDAATDSVEQASPWFSVYGATRVVVRLWSANTSAWTAADSVYTDSLITFRVLMSDSVCCRVAGVGGTVVSAADSMVFDPSVAYSDTTFSHMTAHPKAVNQPLAGSKNGSGLMIWIAPNAGNNNVNITDATGVIAKKLMRIRVTPRQRLTVGGALSTAGIRTRGVRGLRGIAYVYFQDKSP